MASTSSSASGPTSAAAGIARPHNINFTIAPADRPALARWLDSVRAFFALSVMTTAAAAAATGPSLSAAPFSASSYRPYSADTPVSAANDQGGVGISVPHPAVANGALLLGIVPPAAGGPGAGAAADEALEGVTVHYVVHLVSVLGHHQEAVRVRAADLVFDLAAIFDRKPADLRKRMPKIALGFQSDERGFHTPVHELFHYAAPALSIMAIALVAGLECFFTYPDWAVRGVCISALTRIVYENERTFLEEDQLSAVWNLYFSLGSIPLFAKIFPDRVVIIRTALEVEAIKSTLKKVFEKIVEVSGGRKSADAPSNTTTPSLAGINVFSVFLTTLTASDESCYDLLSSMLAIDVLSKLLEDTPFRSVLVPLGLVHDSINGGTLERRLRAFDELANFLYKNKGDLQDLVSALGQKTTVEEFWIFFLKDTPENQLVRPDDYDFGRNFIHAPFWIALVLTKLSVGPPPALGGVRVPSDSASDMAASALEILTMVVRLKLPGVSQAMLFQFLDGALDLAFNSPASIVKIGALEFLQALLLVFPSGMTTNLPEARDVVRSLLNDNIADVRSFAAEVYPLVFHCVSSNNQADFYKYLTEEIAAIEAGGVSVMADPMISSISDDDRENGLRFASSSKARLRLAGLSAIVPQLASLDGVELAAVVWMLLPLSADPHRAVRAKFARFAERLPSRLEALAKTLPPHPDDSFVLNSM
ncbi:hypothetical protein HK405_014015 [Cladochytrium tenue]|nr:hypothetical protein HK405_014015 [Cladochytrium tenue]